MQFLNNLSLHKVYRKHRKLLSSYVMHNFRVRKVKMWYAVRNNDVKWRNKQQQNAMCIYSMPTLMACNWNAMQCNAWQSASHADDGDDMVIVMCIWMSISYQVECTYACWRCLCYIRWLITQIRYEHPIHIFSFSVFFPSFSPLLCRLHSQQLHSVDLFSMLEIKLVKCFQMES